MEEDDIFSNSVPDVQITPSEGLPDPDYNIFDESAEQHAPNPSDSGHEAPGPPVDDVADLQAEFATAIDEYQEQLKSIEEMLQDNPEHEELLQMKQELLEAVALTQQALSSSNEAAAPDLGASHSNPVASTADESEAQHAKQAGSTNSAPRPVAKAPPPKWGESVTAAPDSTLNLQAGTNVSAEEDVATSVLPSAVALGSNRGRNNPRMHPENLYYAQAPDFAALAEFHSPLQQYIKHAAGGKVTIDFTSWEGTRELTKALLKKDFGIEWDLPDGQLIPPVTNRCNYIHWINDLLQLSSPTGSTEGPKAGLNTVRGLDIGCGCNFIYCLLGAAIHKWCMVGTDVTDVAEEWATRNLSKNPQLAPLLSFRRVPQAAKDQEGGILSPAVHENEIFHFCMCNPPFFQSAHQANQNPNTACGGTLEEMVYPGGELAFIVRMIHDSWKLQHRVHWYTSMVGRKDTMKQLRKVLYSLPGVTATRTTEFAQGKTSRWAIAWSFAVDPNKQNQPLRSAQQAVAAGKVQAVGGKVQRQVSFSVQAGHNNGAQFVRDVASYLSDLGSQPRVDQALYSIQAPVSYNAVRDLLEEGATDLGAGQAGQKRSRESGTSFPHPHDFSVRLRIYQQQRGRFDIMASVANDSNYQQTLQFTKLMRHMELHLGQGQSS